MTLNSMLKHLGSYEVRLAALALEERSLGCVKGNAPKERVEKKGECSIYFVCLKALLRGGGGGFLCFGRVHF